MWRYVGGWKLARMILPLLVLAAVMIMKDRLPEPADAPAGGDIAAAVDGEPLTVQELRLHMAEQRARVSAYFNAAYQAEESPAFWTTSYGGEIPLEKLKKEALAAAARSKIPMLLAKREGIVADISYAAFLQGFQSENERRAAAKKNRQPLYGPEQYRESEYYRVYQSNVTGELQKKLQLGSRFSEEELLRYYESRKEQLFKLPDTITVRRLTLTHPEAGSVLAGIKEKADAGMELEEAAAPYKEWAVWEETVTGGGSVRSSALSDPELMSRISSLGEGQVSDVFQANGKPWLAVCIGRAGNGYRAFHEVREGIRNTLASEAFRTLLEERIRDARVEINPQVYGRIRDAELP
ncbi:peptidyl-prolyl cis-trans isomerase [Gorillibacterium sp. sgz5001074]|uniref:peptidylprolyl isomerase n=1 Tax=Gorillibacterium sp. sgz5001074 TaxID=3446695 RepID=UPI003F671F6D